MHYSKYNKDNISLGELLRQTSCPCKRFRFPKLRIPPLQMSPCLLSIALQKLPLGKKVQDDKALATAVAVNNKPP